MHLVDKDAIAAGLGNTFGHGVDPPLAKLCVQNIETKDIVAVGQFARFRINDQELFQFRMRVNLLRCERFVVRREWPRVGRVEVEQHFGFGFDFRKRRDLVLGPQFGGT